MTDHTIGFIGAGAMGGAVIDGLIRSGFSTEAISAACGTIEEAKAAGAKHGIKTTHEASVVAAHSDIIVIAVKPQVVRRVLPDVAAHGKKGALIISVAAGIPTMSIESHLPSFPVIRAMPNLNAMVGQSATSLSPGTNANADHMATAKAIMSTIGTVVEVPENLVDAVTGLSGSGPAYMFMMIEAMVQAGVELGIPKDEATKLAVATMFGSAQTLIHSQEEPSVLRDYVCSPGGTTIAGVNQLEQDGFKAAIIAAIVRAANRSQQLGK